MTSGRNRLDQIVRGLDGVTADLEIIAYSSSVEWRKNQLVSAAQYPHVLPKNIVDFDTPLVRLADAESRVRDLEERLSKAAEALERISSPTQTDNLLWWQVQARDALSQIRSEK